MKSIWKLFSGPSPEKLETRGDALSDAGRWGSAKLEYERALEKSERQDAPEPERLRRLAEKIGRVKEALAQAHRADAADFIEGGFFPEARERIVLAMEITADALLREALRAQLAAVDSQLQQAVQESLPDLHYGLDDEAAEEDVDEETADVPEDEYFQALCAALPESVQHAYLGYGEAFQTGYIALNEGNFQAAAEHLTLAMAAHPEPGSYVALELATAHLNLGRLDEARALLENFITHNRGALPAYQMLSEIYWEQQRFEAVEDLLASVPEQLADSIAVVMLRGETMCRQGRFDRAGALYRGVLDTWGWNDAVAQGLAGVHESMGQPTAARRLYKEMIDRCTSCHAPVEPSMRHKYAELSFADGVRSLEILELYLALAREMPEHAALHFDRVSRIYQTMGNDTEAARFRVFSDRAAAAIRLDTGPGTTVPGR